MLLREPVERADLPIPIAEEPADPVVPVAVAEPIADSPAEPIPVAVAELPEGNAPAPTIDHPLPPADEPPPEEKYTTSMVATSGSRQKVEFAIIFLGAILFLRAMAVEPFGVPTGSMAPTLTGNHRCVYCPRCGYPIRVGDPATTQSRSSTITCPNCGKTGIELDEAPEIPGDRLLVDKNVFSMRSPRRWEAAVFRCPSDLTKPYVKRVLGLPGESIQVLDGDIYINGKIARKSFKDVREVRIPVFDMNFPPKPLGWQHCWLPEPKPLIQDPAPREALVAGRWRRTSGQRLHFGRSNRLGNLSALSIP